MSEITWPRITTDDIPETPEAVLASFANALSQQTNNVLKGVIATQTTSPPGRVTSYFQIVAPLFNNYRYELFSITHGIVPFYPVNVIYKGSGHNSESAETLKSQVTVIINDKSTIEIIKSLIAQSGKEAYEALKNSSLTAVQ